jgi:hypothetical protein
MNRKMRAFFIMLCAGFLSPRMCGSQGWNMELLKSLPTAQGLLQLDEVGQGGYRVYVGGNLIRELEGFGINVWETLPSGDSPQYILLGVSTGNSFCGYKYFLLDVTASPTPYLTREFADCSPLPNVQMQGQDVKIDFPSSHYVKAQEWIYRPTPRALMSEYE